MPRESTLLCLPQRGMICLWRTAGDSGVAFGSTRGRVYNAPHQARVREYTPRIPTVCLDVIPLSTSSCGYYSGQIEQVVYLHHTDKYPRLTHRLSQEQKGLDERALMAS